jgi:hypothetical protein
MNPEKFTFVEWLLIIECIFFIAWGGMHLH